MKVEIKKTTNYHCEYTITRENGSVEQIVLETKTYLLHDICHYVVEKNIKYAKGFWGMLSMGHTFNELFGKANPLTKELRNVEQMVGPVQSVYSGHIAEKDFQQFIEHLDFNMPESVLSNCLAEIQAIMNRWDLLPVGQQLVVDWKG